MSISKKKKKSKRFVLFSNNYTHVDCIPPPQKKTIWKLLEKMNKFWCFKMPYTWHIHVTVKIDKCLTVLWF